MTSDDRISIEEMAALFGSEAPIEAIELICSDNIDVSEIRKRLAEMAGRDTQQCMIEKLAEEIYQLWPAFTETMKMPWVQFIEFFPIESENIRQVARRAMDSASQMLCSQEIPGVMAENDHRIFVFGSNLAGRHGRGAARWALRFRGAVWGVGEGLTGQSYALPTKDERIRTLPIERISDHVERFLIFARNNPSLHFQLTPVGCGLAGYRAEQIAPMFRDAPPNIDIPEEFRAYLET